jgi:hypothetical protein
MKTKQKISKNLLDVIKSLTSSVGMIDTKTSGSKLKPADVGVVNTKDSVKSEKKALYTTISGNQSTKLKKDDSVANILTKIYIAMKEDRLEMIKQKELDRNFREEHIKEKKRRYKTIKNAKGKKIRGKSDAGSPWSLLIMGLISESGNIIKFIKDLIGPWDQFSKKIEDNFNEIKSYVTNELVNDITSFLKDLEQQILAKVGEAYDGMMGQVEGYLINWSSYFEGIHLPRWKSFMDGFSVFNEKKQPRTPESDAETAKLLKELEAKDSKTGKEPKASENVKPHNVIPTATNSPELIQKGETGRSIGDKLETAFNDTAGFVGKVATDVAYPAAKTFVNSVGKSSYKKLSKKFNPEIDKTDPNYLAAKEKIKKLGYSKQEELKVRDKNLPEKFNIFNTDQPMAEDTAKYFPELENPTTSRYLKEQSKLNDAKMTESGGSSGVTTLPPKILPSTNTKKPPSVSVSSSATTRTQDCTLTYIHEKNICRI